MSQKGGDGEASDESSIDDTQLDDGSGGVAQETADDDLLVAIVNVFNIIAGAILHAGDYIGEIFSAAPAAQVAAQVIQGADAIKQMQDVNEKSTKTLNDNRMTGGLTDPMKSFNSQKSLSPFDVQDLYLENTRKNFEQNDKTIDSTKVKIKPQPFK